MDTNNNKNSASSPDGSKSSIIQDVRSSSSMPLSPTQAANSSRTRIRSGSPAGSNKSHKRRRQQIPTVNSTASNSSSLPSSATSSSSNTTENAPPQSLTLLCLSKSWLAAAKVARSHPQEARYGCTSSARTPVPLKNHQLYHMASSPLAIACRYGAPSDTIEAILKADREMVRRLIPNRGTPLHEAIMAHRNGTSNRGGIGNGNHDNSNDETSEGEFDVFKPYVRTIRMLLEADEQLERLEVDQDDKCDVNCDDGSTQLESCDQKTQRATLMQDVDGNVPLHLLVRQAFYNYLTSGNDEEIRGLQHGNQHQEEEHPLLTIIQDVIKSCPEASATPDCTEFEETPLVLVLKSSLYAREQRPPPTNANNSESDQADAEADYNTELERRIFEISKLMIQSHPYAASFVASRSGYTAVHSAVFHGRCCDTIRLLLDADKIYRKKKAYIMKERMLKAGEKCEHAYDHGNIIPISAAMRANQYGETPLHFATMRGECTRTIELLSQAAPWAVWKRDVKFGLTPMHWLLVRFVDIMFEGMRRSFLDEDDTVENGNEDWEEGTPAHRQNEVAEEEQEPLRDFQTHAFAALQAAVNINAHVVANANTNDSCKDAISADETNSGNDGGQIRFDLQYHRRTAAIDPPVDFMRMRHILPEHDELEERLTNRAIRVLGRVRERHRRLMESLKNLQRQQKQQMESLQAESLEASMVQSVAISSSACPSIGKGRKDNLTVDSIMNGSIGSTNNAVVEARSDQDPSECPMKKELKQEQRTIKALEISCPFKMNKVENASAAVSTEDQWKNPISQHDLSSDMVDLDSKKCPFRCPFVSDSYPIDPSLIDSQEEAVREEHVISLFWAKITSLLHAAAVAQSTSESDVSFDIPASVIDDETVFMLHSACSVPSPLAVVRLCLSLNPEQLSLQDFNGRLPLHHAACREWDVREFCAHNNQTNESSNRMHDHDLPNLIKNESSKVLDLILTSSSAEAAKTMDLERRLPFHHALDSALKAVIDHQYGSPEGTGRMDSDLSYPVTDDSTLFSSMGVLFSMIQMYPETMEKKDGRTGLYPFMQASAVACENLSRYDGSRKSNRVTLTLVYSLLLENPSLASINL